LMVRKLKNIIKTSEELKQLISEEIKKM
jgi:hypothetical protein